MTFCISKDRALLFCAEAQDPGDVKSKGATQGSEPGVNPNTEDNF